MMVSTTATKLRAAIIFTAVVLVVTVVLGNGGPPRVWKERKHSAIDKMKQLSSGKAGDNTALLTSQHAYSLMKTGQPPSSVVEVKLSMPCPEIFLPTELLFRTDWMDHLLQFLSGLSVSQTQVKLVAANNAYGDVLLNWLISATVVVNPPLKHILILALDGTMYEILKEKQIPCIHVPLQSVLNASNRIMTNEFLFQKRAVLMVRMAFLRIINWLGFDVASIDLDALILKNPQPLFKKYKTDIVGSIGLAWPPELFEKWNFTLCTGVVFIRSNRRTEEYWNTLADLATKRKFIGYSDQARLNFGLRKLNIKWEGDAQELHLGNVVVGICQNNLSVTILPPSMICRDCSAEQRNSYYIWHQFSAKVQHAKKVAAQKANNWLLRGEWRELTRTSALKGKDWLKLISKRVHDHY